MRSYRSFIYVKLLCWLIQNLGHTRQLIRATKSIDETARPPNDIVWSFLNDYLLRKLTSSKCYYLGIASKALQQVGLIIFFYYILLSVTMSIYRYIESAQNWATSLSPSNVSISSCNEQLTRHTGHDIKCPIVSGEMMTRKYDFILQTQIT